MNADISQGGAPAAPAATTSADILPAHDLPPVKVVNPPLPAPSPQPIVPSPLPKPSPPPSSLITEQLTHTFQSADDLGAWRDYFESVYGVSTMTFPFSLASLNFFYQDRLPKSVRKTLRVRGPDAQGGNWGWHELDSGGPLRRGDLYHLYDSNHIFRCELDVCSSESADTACVQQGFTGEKCRSAGPARHMRFNLSLLQRHTRTAAARHHLMALHSMTQTSAATRTPVMARHGEPNNTLVEVIHNWGDPPRMGFWFFYAKGSGVYFNLR